MVNTDCSKFCQLLEMAVCSAKGAQFDDNDDGLYCTRLVDLKLTLVSNVLSLVGCNLTIITLYYAQLAAHDYNILNIYIYIYIYFCKKLQS